MNKEQMKVREKVKVGLVQEPKSETTVTSIHKKEEKHAEDSKEGSSD